MSAGELDYDAACDAEDMNRKAMREEPAYAHAHAVHAAFKRLRPDAEAARRAVAAMAQDEGTHADS